MILGHRVNNEAPFMDMDSDRWLELAALPRKRGHRRDCLEHLRQMGQAQAPVVELFHPMPARKPVLTGLWAILIAYYIFVHSIPLLAVGVMPHDAKDSPSHLTPAGLAKMERLMRPVIRRLHISNTKELRMLFWVPGVILTCVGIGFLVWGSKRQGDQTRENNRLYDLELERIMCVQSASLLSG